jgi:hypothetical protein
VRELLSLGKDVDEVACDTPFFEARDYMTPLCLAAMNGDEETIKLLLNAGAVIGCETPISRGGYEYYSECAIVNAKDARVRGWIGEEVLRRHVSVQNRARMEREQERWEEDCWGI